MATALRMPVAKRLPFAGVWLSLVPSNTHTPPYFSRIGQGFWPIDPSCRSFSWQEFEGAPTLTYRVPLGSSAKVLSECWRSFGKFADHGLARTGGRELALLEWIAVHAHIVGYVQPVLENAHFGAFDIAERRDDVGLAVAVGIAQRGESVAAAEIDVAVGGHVEVPARALALLHHDRGESRRQREAVVTGA